MDEKLKKQMVTEFLNNKTLSKAVYEVLIESYLSRSKGNDIHMLASERIAIDLLKDGWKELVKLKNQNEQDVEIKKQIGL